MVTRQSPSAGAHWSTVVGAGAVTGKHGLRRRYKACRAPKMQALTWSFAPGAPHAASLDSAGLSPAAAAAPGSSPRHSQRSSGSSSGSPAPAAPGPPATLPVAPGTLTGGPLRAHKLRPVRDTCTCTCNRLNSVFLCPEARA